MENYTVYVLRSLKDGKRYIGYTKNVLLRFREHEQGLVKSTKNRRPFKLIYSEEFTLKSTAMKREKFLKTGQGREFLNNIPD